MSMIIALGSNLGNKRDNLNKAKWILASHYELIAESSIYSSKAVDYIDQPDFLNQLLEFKAPQESPDQVMTTLLEIENILGRIREIPKGPRTLDLDVIFIGTQKIKTALIEVPHPRWNQRSFILKPLTELPFYSVLKKQFAIPILTDNIQLAIN